MDSCSVRKIALVLVHRNFKSLTSPGASDIHICVAEYVIGIVLCRCAIILARLDIAANHVSGKACICALGTGYLAGHKGLTVREIRNGNRRIAVYGCKLQLCGLIVISAIQGIECRRLARIGRTVIVDDAHAERQFTA